jgi:hypothetical protein
VGAAATVGDRYRLVSTVTTSESPDQVKQRSIEVVIVDR